MRLLIRPVHQGIDAIHSWNDLFWVERLDNRVLSIQPAGQINLLTTNTAEWKFLRFEGFRGELFLTDRTGHRLNHENSEFFQVEDTIRQYPSGSIRRNSPRGE